MKKKDQKSKTKALKKLVPNAGLALKNEFYLEAAWLVSLIIESKLLSVINRVEENHPGTGTGFERSLKRLKYIMLKTDHPLLVKHFEIRLIDELRKWKNYRNNVFKDMIETHVSKARFKKMAEDGIVLLHELNSSCKKFKSDWKKYLKTANQSTHATDESKTPD
jgi:hypothetical protein